MTRSYGTCLTVMATVCLLLLASACKDRVDYIEELTGREPSNKVRAAKALSKYDDPVTMRALLTGLNDPDKSVRVEALKSMAEIVRRNKGKDPSGEALEPLGRLVKYDQDNKIRALALDLVGEIADDGAVDLLIKMLDFRMADVRVVRAESAKLLGEKKVARAEAALIGVLLGDPDMDVRKVAAWALGEVGGAEAVGALEIVASDPHYAEIHRYANESLEKLGQKPAAK